MKRPVLVLGGGIAGIQASLDLAEMDVPVFLVESSPSIGGRMAQLDKTFPTNDCSACILAPKVTSCFNHPLIKTFTYSELLDIKGEAPYFTAVVKKKARFIDEDACVGCSACTKKCPIERKNEFDLRLGKRRAIYKPYAQAVPNKVVIEKKGTSPCKYNCPAHMDAHGYVALIGQGRYEEALEIVRRTTPFAGVLGRVCVHPCEEACSRRFVDSAVSLASLKRFIADYEIEHNKAPKIKITNKAKDKNIAIIGSGPAGLNCAYKLAIEGYKVTVFEALPEAGGMLRSIPDEKLDKLVLDREIGIIRDLGVEILCNTSLGTEAALEGLRKRGYSAIFITDGALIDIYPSADIFIDEDSENQNTSVIEEIAIGNRMARRIMNYLEGTNLSLEPALLPETPVEEIDFSGAVRDERAYESFDDKVLTEDEARKEALRCVDCSICCECRMCEKVCGSKAINHDQKDEIIKLPVSSVIFANGYDTSSSIPDGYGYGKYKDVVTSLEYERILSASGPYDGHIKRLSDGEEPQRIAFIQCVGSRDEKCGSGYCSGVCCMYAVKEAVITKEHLPSMKGIDIFYMDMRAYGKDFDKYVDSAKSKHGINFIRSRVSDVERDEETGKLVLKHCDERGSTSSSEYDMVVLSVGLSPKRQVQELFKRSGIKTDRFGYVWTNEMESPKSSRDGIFVCGAASGPKDIPETVVEASAAASESSKIAAERSIDYEDISAYFKKEEAILERDVSKEPVRIGVFVCHCGSNIGGYLDVKEVARYAKTLPHVEYSGDLLYACSIDSQKTMVDRIKKYNLNRVVVASCTPRTHEALFQGVLVKAGLNPYLITMANIRDQCSWVHMNEWDRATKKAKDLVRMAVGRIAYSKPLARKKVEVTKSALVIGGGAAGMTAALEIANMGFKAYLVEKTDKLGGNALFINTSYTGRPVSGYKSSMIDKVMENGNIKVFLNTEVKKVNGYVGKYTSTLSGCGCETYIDHGVVIVATGARESDPREYLYGSSQNILTQLELEDRLKSNRLDFNKTKSVFMIQCVGSRDTDRPYCSRVCCSQAIKNALHLKEENPQISITILYRDIRSYGLNEANYRKARKAGVQFVRYEQNMKPEVLDDNGDTAVKFYEPILDSYITSKADMVVLSSAMEPDADTNRKIAQLFKVPLNQDYFFMEAHAKLRPVDFATEGVYLCGLAHSPKTMKESITQGKAAAARAATVISKDTLETEGAIAEVNKSLCTGCGTCEKVCAYKAISIEEVKRRGEISLKARVNPVLCKGCGTCSASCRCGAIDVNGFADRQVINEIEYLLRQGV